MSKEKINIGFDIGTTSVGWSIIDENYNIIDMGVRLFDDPANPKDGKLKNAKRREARCSRRRIRRIKTRKQAFCNFLIENKWINNEDELIDLINIDITKFNVDNPVQLKVEAINKKISQEALIFILFHYIHHRGFFYITQEMLENDENAKLNNNDSTFPSTQMLEFYDNNGYYKGAKLNHTFSAEQWIKEIEHILKIQDINQNFTDGYISIFKMVRDFATGPGSVKSPTPYGLYRTQKDGTIKKIGDNLWDETIGKCTYFENEFRGLRNSPIAELFNWLNDINNLYFFNDKSIKLQENSKLKLFDVFNKSFTTDKTKNLNLGLICSSYVNETSNEFYDSIEEENIKGYREELKKGKSKPLFTELKNYRLIVKWMYENKIWLDKIDLIDLSLLKAANEVFSIIVKNQDVRKQLTSLNENFPNSKEESNIKLLEDLKGLSQTHSLSYKAMLLYMEDSIKDLDNSRNQMSFFNTCYIVKSLNNKNKFQKYLKTGLYDDEIISPTARRAFNQNVKIMNKIIKVYGDEYQIDNITFELARDKNSADERKNIEEVNRKNKTELEDICEEFNININKLNSITRMKLKLWKEQDKCDIYDGMEITIEDVLSGKNLDIDHIIAYSICSINARYNKVLTKKYNNQEKGNLTPYQWLSRKDKFKEFEERVNKIFPDKKNKKRDKLLYLLDPLQNMDSFIERNLVDTRYAAKVVLNTFQEFFANNDRYQNTKIKVINGSVTNYARYSLFTNSENKTLIPKDRDVYCHHAIDASIVCFLGMNYTISKLTSYWNKKERTNNNLRRNKEDNSLINDETGEVIDISATWEKNQEIKNFGVELSKWNETYNSITKKGEFKGIGDEKQIKFSRQLSTRKNIQLSNETIYSFIWDDEQKTKGHIVSKINLLEEKISDLDKFFKDSVIQTDSSKSLNSLLVYKHDKNLYEKLKTIYNQFYDLEINPFIAYMKQKIENPKYIEIENQRIKSLRLIGDAKEEDNIIIINKGINNNNKFKRNGIMETLKALEVRIYKNDLDKYITFPINQKVLSYKNNKMIIDESKLENQLQKLKISNFKKYFVINNGTIFIKKQDNSLYFSNGGGSLNKNILEIKSLYAENVKSGFPRNRMQINLSTIIKEYDMAEVDELGKIYNRHQIEL